MARKDLQKIHERKDKWYREVLSRYACFENFRAAMKAVEEESGEKIYANVAYRYRASEEGQKLIRAVREKYLKAVSEVPIYHKRVRLERLEKEYNGSADVRDRIKVLSEARKEVEGEGGGDLYFQVNQFSGLSDEELMARRAEILKKLKRETMKVIEGEGKEVNGDGDGEVQG